MESINKTTEKVLLKLLKEPYNKYTATLLAEDLGITRQGIWKILNKLLCDKLITIESIGKSKKSAVIISLEWKNPITIRTLSLLLTKEGSDYERWRTNFLPLEDHVEFLILYGSILHFPKDAGDIDIIVVVKNKKDFKLIGDLVSKIQKTQTKKIHLIDLSSQEFKEELKKQNKAYIDSLKKGIILYKQDNYIKFIESLRI